MVLRPGFEPGSVAREATILNRTILPEPRTALLCSFALAVGGDAILVAEAYIFSLPRLICFPLPDSRHAPHAIHANLKKQSYVLVV